LQKKLISRGLLASDVDCQKHEIIIYHLSQREGEERNPARQFHSKQDKQNRWKEKSCLAPKDQSLHTRLWNLPWYDFCHSSGRIKPQKVIPLFVCVNSWQDVVSYR